MDQQCTVLLFGATGDLAARKLIPALHDLQLADGVSHRLIGIANSSSDANSFMEKARPHVRHLDSAVWEALVSNAHYVCGDFSDNETYAAIKNILGDYKGPLLAYCASSSDYFVSITEQLVARGIMRKQDEVAENWHRIAYEKPFGFDAISAREMNDAIVALLSEEQIFRVDHFLGKKATMALPAARMLEESFNDLWCNGDIESIQVVVSETAGIHDRGAYYDRYGVLKDMVQNHVLQIVALLLSDNPFFEFEIFSREKKKALHSLRIVDGVLGQYKGYRDENAVTADSSTPTFAALALSSNMERWRGIPVFVKTGKMLDSQKFVVHLVFRSADITVSPDMPLAMIAYSDNDVGIFFGAEEITRALEATASPRGNPDDSLNAYGRVLEFIMQGDHTISVSFEEILAAWQIVDAFIEKSQPVHAYA